MKLSKYRNDYYGFSAKASDVCRTLAFAGIAICWIFKSGQGTPRLPTDLLPPVALFAIGLALDLLHYVVATAIWGTFSRIHEKRQQNLERDPPVTAPKQLNWPTLCFFWLKIAAVCAGYGLLIDFLIKKWIVGSN
jgi:hypothetical protein